jgi:serine/threonine protein kinase
LQVLILVLYCLKNCQCHEDSDCRIVLVDFGFSKPVEQGVSSVGRGTAGYRSPELLEESGKTFSYKSDIWAMGGIIMDVASTGGRTAFQTDAETTNYNAEEGAPPKLTSEDNPDLDDSILEHLNSLMEGCFQRHPEDRPTAAKLLKLVEENWGQFGWDMMEDLGTSMEMNP